MIIHDEFDRDFESKMSMFLVEIKERKNLKKI